MATIALTPDRMRLELTPGERLSGLHGDVVVSLSAVTDIRLIDDAFEAVRGLRAPGLALPGVMRVGTWRKRGRRMFVVARRGVPALHITLGGTKVTDIVVSLRDAASQLETLHAHLVRLGVHRINERDLRFSSGHLEIAGTETAALESPRAVALLLPGSGEVDRNADHRRFPLGISRALAHGLARAGVLTLRYDKRGVGASGGEFLATGLSDNIADASAALETLRAAHPTLPVFVIGHSEGAMIAESLAADAAGLAGVVLLAAPGTTGEATMTWQAKQISSALPVFARIVTKVLRVDIVAQQRKAIDAIKATTGAVARVQGRKINAKWQRELLAFDPVPLLGRITAPVLAITGGKDLQVNPDDLEVIAATVPAPVDCRRARDITHLLRADPDTPTVGAYKKLAQQHMDAQLLADVVDWVAANAA